MGKMNLFPTPKYYCDICGEFVFSDKVYMILPEGFGNEDFVALAPELWSNFTAGKSRLEIIRDKAISNVAYISVTPEGGADKSTEYDYEIFAEESGITLVSMTENGLIRAFLSLLQMLPAYSLKNKRFTMPCFEIKDSPTLKMRCIHLCVLPETTLLFLKKTVRLLALLKCTHIILEFFAMLKLDCFPYLAWSFGYTKDDIAPIIRDGRAMGIEFIPMFNHMGHAGGSRFRLGKNVVLDQAPEYEEYFLPGGWTWNVENPDVLSLFERMRAEMCEIFGCGRYFHIGCDEVYAADSLCDPYDKEDNEKFVAFINKTADSIKKLGRTPIMWGDMFLDDKDFPYPYCGNISHRCCLGAENLGKISRDIIIADWQYNIGGDRSESVDLFLRTVPAENLLLCPWTGFDNIKGRCDIAKEKSLPGVIGTTWTDIYREPKFSVYTACLMWEGKDTETPSARWEIFKLHAAQNIRKLVPSGGIYEDAGFYGHELDAKPL
ncbi:MAG: family 20 glycosylhydrolase [Clostridia bacterium]|nr:family 20 glycosylhydrolase [Clostridia bacterium]